MAVAEDDDTVVTNVGTAESVRTAAVPGRSVGKLLVVERERPGRISVVFVDESLGF